MKLGYRNALVVLLATATLLGGLFNPPYVEPPVAADVPSVERLHPGNGAVPGAVVSRKALPSVALSQSAVVQGEHSQVYVPIRDYVEERNGRLIFNRETASVDIVVEDVSFSLLLAEGVIMSNGHAIEGGYNIQDGTAYISIEALTALLTGDNALYHA